MSVLWMYEKKDMNPQIKCQLPSPVIAQAGWMCHNFWGSDTLLLLLLELQLVFEVLSILELFSKLGTMCNADTDESSCRESNFSISFMSLADGRSCLLANINIGVP